MEYKLYEGGELGENQYLLKIDTDRKVGFLSKLNKTGTIPKPFKDWGNPSNYYNYKPENDLPIYLYEETFRSGWRIENFRFGESQNWAILMHPEGFMVEVYMREFRDVILENSTFNGEIIGEFKWEANKLIKK